MLRGGEHHKYQEIGGVRMTKYYVKWQLNPMLPVEDPEERGKLWVKMLQMVKADMEAGRIKDWGN
jgi:hypothetical protein